MSILSVVQDFCDQLALTRPQTLFGTDDDAIAQMLALAGRGHRDIMREEWGARRKEVSFTTIAQENQGPVTSPTVFGPDFESLVEDTLWNATQKLPLNGPQQDQSWSSYRNFLVTGPVYKFTIINNELHLLPPPPAGQTLRAFVRSRYGVVSASGTRKETFTENTDTTIYPESVLLKALDYLWKRAKGLPYVDEQADYDYELRYHMGRNNLQAGSLNLGYVQSIVTPGISIPPGSWSL